MPRETAQQFNGTVSVTYGAPVKATIHDIVVMKTRRNAQNADLLDAQWGPSMNDSPLTLAQVEEGLGVSFSDHLVTLYPDMDREQVCRDHLWTGTILPAISQDQAALLERATEAWTNKNAAARNSVETAQRARAVFEPHPTMPYRL